jgi:putative endonuclease
MEERRYCVYILTNDRNTVLYTGVTGDIARRIEAHRSKVVKGFTSKYNVTKLVYVAVADTADAAIAEEKRIKGGSRAKKIAMIESQNPDWKDLSDLL